MINCTSRKLGLIALFLIASSAVFSQLTYNKLIHDGLSHLEEEIGKEQVAKMLQSVEELLIFNEVNHDTCEFPLVYIHVVNEDGKPADKFRISIIEEEGGGDYDYTTIHKGESSTIWIDEALNGFIPYHFIAHRKSKISDDERSRGEYMEIDHNQCSFIFKKLVLPSN